MTQSAVQQQIEAKVDLINLKVIIRKTEHRIHANSTEKFCLTKDGFWRFVPEGEVYPDVCELPIAHFRDEKAGLIEYEIPIGA